MNVPSAGVRLAALLVALGGPGAGCSTLEVAAQYDDTGYPSDLTDSGAGGVRVDVYPPSDLDAGLGLPQSYPVFLEGVPSQSAALVLSEPVVFSGMVSSYQISPWVGAELPGTWQPVHAVVDLSLPGTIQSAIVATDQDGSFEGQVVPGAGYLGSVVPADPELPFLVEVMDLSESRDQDIEIPAGAAVWGAVSVGGEVPLVGARVRAEHVATGVQGGEAMTDGEGRYLLRVLPGEYRIVCSGRNNGRDPTVGTGVLDIDEAGLAVDIVYPDLDYVTVGGRVVDNWGEPVADATVRISAMELDGYPADTRLEIDAVTSAAGTWDMRVLPGRYQVEVRPADEVDLTPAVIGKLLVDGSDDLGEVALGPMSPLFGWVVDEAGEPVEGAIVRVAEVGFGERSWSVHSDETGLIHLLAPQVPLEFTLSPPASRLHDLALTRVVHDPVRGDPTLVLATGLRLRGAVRSGDGPVSYAVVEVRGAGEELLGVTATDSDGQFDVGVSVAW